MKIKYIVVFCLCVLGLITNSLPLISQNNQAGTDVLKNWTVFQEQGQFEKAIEQAKLIQEFAENTNNQELLALALNKEGLSLLKISKRTTVNRRAAKRSFEKSLELLATIENKDLEISNLTQLLAIAKLEEDEKSISVYQKQLNEIESIISSQESNEQLSQKVQLLGGEVKMLDSEKNKLQDKVASLSEAQMKAELLVSMQKHYLDSLQMTRMKDSFLLVKKEMELHDQAVQLTLKENEIQLKSSQRNFLFAIAGILLILAVGTFLRFTGIKKYNTILHAKNEALIEEKKRSETLLLNILPAIVAQELKESGSTKARRYEQATVMFTDFRNFSGIARSLSPEDLVAELDFYFKAFDKIIGKYRIEKIKTIGDAYMCVGGLPDVEGSTAKDVVFAALEIQELLIQLKNEREHTETPYFEARIGIHTGPLVAGVVGSIKFAYDIWGDTVNTASRLETNGEPWRVNISGTTYELVKKDFDCTPRGLIPIKNGKEIAMYFVNRPLHSNA